MMKKLLDELIINPIINFLQSPVFTGKLDICFLVLQLNHLELQKASVLRLDLRASGLSASNYVAVTPPDLTGDFCSKRVSDKKVIAG